MEDKSSKELIKNIVESEKDFDSKAPIKDEINIAESKFIEENPKYIFKNANEILRKIKKSKQKMKKLKLSKHSMLKAKKSEIKKEVKKKMEQIKKEITLEIKSKYNLIKKDTEKLEENYWNKKSIKLKIENPIDENKEVFIAKPSLIDIKKFDLRFNNNNPKRLNIKDKMIQHKVKDYYLKIQDIEIISYIELYEYSFLLDEEEKLEQYIKNELVATWMALIKGIAVPFGSKYLIARKKGNNLVIESIEERPNDTLVYAPRNYSYIFEVLNEIIEAKINFGGAIQIFDSIIIFQEKGERFALFNENVVKI